MITSRTSHNDILTGETLKRQLEQQKLMSTLSLSFISTEDMSVLINSALRTTGEFLGVTRMVIGVPNRREGITRPAFAWFDTEDIRPAPTNTDIGALIAGSFPEHAPPGETVPCICCDDVTADDKYSVLQKVDVKSFIWAPLYVSGRIWGILSIEECVSTRAWSESDLQLITLINSVITGAVARSVTERKLVHLSSIVENSPQFICYLDADGRIEYINEGAVRLSGYGSERIMERGVEFLFGRAIRTQLQMKIGAAENVSDENLSDKNAPDENLRRELIAPLRCRDGEARMLNLSVFPVEGKGLGLIGLDITEQLRLQEQLVEAKNQAENSSSAKSEFLSRMSHEMRTPMNAIIGMTSIGKASDSIERKDYCLGKVDEASKHLLGVINDILDMSKIEAGKFEVSLAEFRLEKMLQRVTNVIGFRMDEKRIDFGVNLTRDLPVSIISDDQRLAQVITNLLSNAVKFTPENGSITLSARCVDESDELCRLEFSVTDTGIGISAQNQAKLFNSFEQADGSISRKFGGTGLGLAISKRIVELLGGEIWVESEEGRGSSFIFYVMAMRGAGEGRRVTVPTLTRESMRILAVDDSQEVLEYFASLADSINISCDVAPSGEEACRMIEKNGENYYSLMFVDWRMPVMNGLELTRIIKERYSDRIVVIMISATEWIEIEADAKAAGVDGFVSKPLFPSNIVDCINEHLGVAEENKAEKAEPTGAYEEGCFEGCRILLAEDVEVNSEIVVALLEDTRIAIDTVTNGIEAVDAFKNDPERYDLIFMDIHMPEMDGYQATRAIRALDLPRAAKIPIVAMTANVFREDIERCLAAGMNDHVGKPIDMDEIMKKLFKYLPGKAVRPAGNVLA
jgi:PAS domain S-box-containing protein